MEEQYGVGEEIPGDGMADDPIAEAEAKPKKVDLSEIPEWRQAQSSYDRQINELRTKLQTYEQRVEEQSLAGMDDYERAEYQTKKLATENETLKRELMETRIEQARREGLKAISEKYKVPVSELDDGSPEAAEASALRYLLAQRDKSEPAQEPQRQRNNSVDLGGGSPRGKEAGYRAKYNQLMKARDTVGLVNLKMQAGREGIDL